MFARLNRLLNRKVPIPPMVVAARYIMQALMQRASKSDIDFLDSTTGSEKRNLAPDCRTDNGESKMIAIRVTHILARRRILTIMVGIDIGHTAGQHDSVHHVKQYIDVNPVAERRNKQRQRPGYLRDRSNIAIACRVMTKRSINLEIAGNTHNGAV